MKYYLVALFNKDSYENLEPIQKQLSKKYKLYKNLPTLHITLEIIENPNIQKLDTVLTKLIKPYKNFKVEFNNIVCFGEPYKSVNIGVENQGYIKRLFRCIDDTLRLHGFNVKLNTETWNLHVSLANSYFAQREWKKQEYESACSTTKLKSLPEFGKIDRIELWKPINNKKEMVVLSYPLKSF